MHTIVLEKPGLLAFQTTKVPFPAPGEALVRILRVGICGTDYHAFAGRQPFFSYPRILGHELACKILQIAPGGAPADGKRPRLQVGDRCAIEPYVHCGHCPPCQMGRYNCCESLACLGVHVDGGMRELISVPLELLHPSEMLSNDQLALVETLGIGCHAVDRGGLKKGESALVVGVGPIGLAVVQFAMLTGANVYVLEPNAARLARAEYYGAQPLAAAPRMTFDVVIDATGNAGVMGESLNYVAHGGRLVFVGLVQGTVAIDDPLFHRREVTLLASRNSCHDFPRIMKLISENRLDTRPWITHRLTLEEVPKRFAEIRETDGVLKAMIEVPLP